MGAAVRIVQLRVRAARVECTLLLSPDAPRYTTPDLVARACASFPDLPQHACVNAVGNTFASVMDHTPLPHLIEHIAISLQVRAAAQADARAAVRSDVYVGTSEWVDERAGRALVQVSFTDDLAALRALNGAVTFVNEALCELPAASRQQNVNRIV